MFDLGHLEFANPKHAIFRRYFVSIRHTDLSTGKRKFAVVVFVAALRYLEFGDGSTTYIWQTHSRLKARKIPCDVSGRKKPLLRPDGPISDANIILKSLGSDNSLPDGDLISYLSNIASKQSDGLVVTNRQKVPLFRT